PGPDDFLSLLLEIENRSAGQRLAANPRRASSAARRAVFGYRKARYINIGALAAAGLSDSRATSMRHVIGILLQNEAGALSRVAGLFSTRGYNIESLSVAPPDDPSVSRLTLVTQGSEAVIHQISNQLFKLVDVVSVADMTRGEHVERELLLIKIRVPTEQQESLKGLVARAAGKVLSVNADYY